MTLSVVGYEHLPGQLTSGLDLLALLQPMPSTYGGVDQAPDFEIPQNLQSSPDVAPWNSVSPMFIMEDPSAISPSPPQQYFRRVRHPDIVTDRST